MERSIGYVVLAANDMRDAHLAVVNDDREIVEWVVYRAGNRKIFELRRVESNVAADDIGKGDDFSRIAHTHDTYHVAGLLFTLLLGEVRLVLVDELLQHLRMRAGGLGRAVEFFPREAEPVQLLDDVFFVFARAPFFVGIFAAENEEDIIEQL